MDAADTRRRIPLRLTPSAVLPRTLLVLAFSAAAAAFGVGLGPEARFLAATGSVGLTGIALLGRARGHATAGAAVFLLLALVALPESPVRGMAITAVLAVFGTATACGRWLRERDLSFAATLGIALLFQVGFRPGWLLPGDLDLVGIARLLLPPFAVAAVSFWTARHQAPATRLVALLVVLTLARGATTTAAVALLASWIPELLAALSRKGRMVLAAGALAGLLVRPTLVVAAIVGGALRGRRSPWMVVSGVALWVAAWIFGIEHSSTWTLLLVVLLPALLWPGLRRPWLVVGLVVFAFGASRWAGIGGGAIAGSLAVVALGRETLLPRVSLPWAAWVGVACLLPSSYPWLRGPELLLRPGASWVIGVGVLALLAVFVLLQEFAAQRRWLWVLFGLGAWSVAVAALPTSGVDLGRDEVPVVLGEATPEWGEDWEGGRVGRVSVQVALADSSSLARGEEAGWVELLLANEQERRFPLVVGESIGDWASAREPALPSPEAWVHWATGDGFFGRRYRVSWTLDPPESGVERIRVVRHADLPSEVGLIVWHLRAGP